MLHSAEEPGTGYLKAAITEMQACKNSIKVSINLFICVEVLRPSQPNGVMSSAVSLPNHTFIGQA